MEQGEFLRAIEAELTLILKDHQSLRELREQRRREDVEKRLEDSKPLVEVIESIIRKSPLWHICLAALAHSPTHSSQ